MKGKYNSSAGAITASKMDSVVKIFFVLFALFSSFKSGAQQQNFRDELKSIIQSTNGKVGVAIMDLGGTDTMTFMASHHFPMQSVYKFPLAMAILDQVDKGKFFLAQKIHVTKNDLRPETLSPLRDKFPEGNIDIELSELLAYTVSKSDNNACDILFRLIGGPEKVNAYVHSLGVNDIAIATTEEQMQKDWKAQYSNWSTPSAMVQLLEVFFSGKRLSKEGNDFLWKLMVETTPGADKIKGMMPPGTVVAHKSGASSTNDKGIIAAANDVGIVSLPNGKYFAIAVYISETTDKAPQCAEVIAKISRAALNHYAYIRN